MITGLQDWWHAREIVKSILSGLTTMPRGVGLFVHCPFDEQAARYSDDRARVTTRAIQLLVRDHPEITVIWNRKGYVVHRTSDYNRGVRKTEREIVATTGNQVHPVGLDSPMVGRVAGLR